MAVDQDQEASKVNDSQIVPLKPLDGGSSCFGDPFYPHEIDAPAKVFLPGILARLEKRNAQIGLRVGCRRRGSFVAVAVPATPRQIGKFIGALRDAEE